MSSNTIKEFFKLNIWHVVILVGWLLSASWFMSKWSLTIEMLDKKARINTPGFFFNAP